MNKVLLVAGLDLAHEIIKYVNSKRGKKKASPDIEKWLDEELKDSLSDPVSLWRLEKAVAHIINKLPIESRRRLASFIVTPPQ